MKKKTTQLNFILNLFLQSDFFDLSRRSYYAYIIVSSSNDNPDVRVTFQVDYNPLGLAFLRRCYGPTYFSFKGTQIFKPFKNSDSLYFGCMSSRFNYYLQEVSLGDKNQYKKFVFKGAIGLYNNFDNADKIRDQSMRVYINMENTRCTISDAVHYVGDGGLQFCFGYVYEGLEELEELMQNENTKHIIKECGVIDMGPMSVEW